MSISDYVARKEGSDYENIKLSPLYEARVAQNRIGTENFKRALLLPLSNKRRATLLLTFHPTKNVNCKMEYYAEYADASNKIHFSKDCMFLPKHSMMIVKKYFTDNQHTKLSHVSVLILTTKDGVKKRYRKELEHHWDAPNFYPTHFLCYKVSNDYFDRVLRIMKEEVDIEFVLEIPSLQTLLYRYHGIPG